MEFMMGMMCGAAAYYGCMKYAMPKLKALKDKYFK